MLPVFPGGVVGGTGAVLPPGIGGMGASEEFWVVAFGGVGGVRGTMSGGADGSTDGGVAGWAVGDGESTGPGGGGWGLVAVLL